MHALVHHGEAVVRERLIIRDPQPYEQAPLVVLKFSATRGPKTIVLILSAI